MARLKSIHFILLVSWILFRSLSNSSYWAIVSDPNVHFSSWMIINTKFQTSMWGICVQLVKSALEKQVILVWVLAHLLLKSRVYYVLKYLYEHELVWVCGWWCLRGNSPGCNGCKLMVRKRTERTWKGWIVLCLEDSGNIVWLTGAYYPALTCSLIFYTVLSNLQDFLISYI